jgi:tRNA 2-selenouridine synthase
MKSKSLPIFNFLKQSVGHVIIDVRAPIEFKKGHIANAINVPLFEDIERAEIGTLYKQQGKDIAVTRGLEIVSPKLVPFVNQVKKLSSSKKIFVYCFRGGMRSNSFAWLMNTSGLDATILEGGYKNYRNHVLNYFEREKKLVVLGGMTGSGKTDLLKNIKHDNFQIIDLEALANHKGSAFGSINEEKQNPQQVFENNLFYALNLLDEDKHILVEDESQSIGFNKIPRGFWLQMKKAPIIKLEVPFELRVQKLVQDYTTTNIEALKICIKKIEQNLGTQNANLCLNYLDENNLTEVARLTLKYYDKAYSFTYNKKTSQQIIPLVLDTMNIEENTLKLKMALKSLTIYNAN